MKNPPFFRKPFKYTFFYATIILIIVNFAIFAFLKIFPSAAKYLALNPICIVYFKMFWQFVSYMFVHIDFSHIFCNMLGLLFFGIGVEKAIGSKEFILFYFFTGIFTGILSFFCYLFYSDAQVFLMGASGAIYAVLFAYAVIYPRSTIYIWGIIPVPAPVLVGIYALIEIVSQLFGRNSGVSHLSHLFGFLFAWIYFRIRMGIKPIQVWKNSR